MTYSDSIKISVFKMAKEKINKSTVVVCKILQPIKIQTIVEFRQLFSETCIAVDICI